MKFPFVTRKHMEHEIEYQADRSYWSGVKMILGVLSKSEGKIYYKPVTLVGDGYDVHDCVFVGNEGSTALSILPSKDYAEESAKINIPPVTEEFMWDWKV